MQILKKSLIVFLIISFIASCSGDQSKAGKKKIVLKPRNFISLPVLEKAGIEHIAFAGLEIMFRGEVAYILCHKDNLLLSFKGDQPLRKYQAYGQGPGEFLRTVSLFLYDANTIGVFDNTKCGVLLFDLDLNFIREQKINTGIRKLYHSPQYDCFYAFGDFFDTIFVKLDRNFKEVEYFGEPNKVLPFKNYLPGLLNMGYLLDEGLVAHSEWMFSKKECEIKIINPRKKQIQLTLKWSQAHTPTQKDIDTFTNGYGSFNVEICGKYYMVYNTFNPTIRGKKIPDLLIFDEKGNVVYRDQKFAYDIISSCNKQGDPGFYVLDKDDNIVFMEIVEE